MIAFIALGCSLVALVVALWAYFEVRDLRDDHEQIAAMSSPDVYETAARRVLLLDEFKRLRTPE